MKELTEKLQTSPLLARTIPFVAFLLLTSCQGSLGQASHYWIYTAKCVCGVWLVWITWPLVPEMRWVISLEALFTGTLVFAIWVALDSDYPKLSQPDNTWNLPTHLKSAPEMVWFFTTVRIAGSTLLVPLLEEVFYRSFLYRYISAPNWLYTPLNQFNAKAFLATSVIFGLTHQHWLAGVLCGMIYQLLVIHTNRIGDAITAHATTNLLLGFWVITQGFGFAEEQWHFW